jgi:FlaA1/EpsC-like NDP-sugar epimerase
MDVLVTGSDGFIGRLVCALLEQQGHTPVPFDLPRTVLDPFQLSSLDADAAIHLAADKYAVNGEDRPEEIAELNVVGTGNVVRAVPRVVLASTCKAASPITCYGASKLIAERAVLNAGGSVVRLVNVLGSSGSVTEIWKAIPEHEPIPVANCDRMFMEPDHAARLLVGALFRPPGRYGPNGVASVHMDVVARRLYPGRPKVRIPLRNGDRPVERLANEYERVVALDSDTVEIRDIWADAEYGTLRAVA